MVHVPLRVDFTLAGVVGRSPHPIHLDAMIASHLIRSQFGLAPTQEQADHALANLPLEKREIGDTWVWAASSIAFEWTGPASQVTGIRAFRAPDIAKHCDVIRGKRGDAGIDTGKSQWKSEQYANPIQQASRARAYAIGDLEAIRTLLEGMTSIGAQRRHNPANVIGVTVEPDPAALDLWVRRYLPFAADIKAPCREGAYRLPMFERGNQTVVKDNHLEFA